MPLQIRRGTDAERSSKVFAEGELIYVTNTGAIWVGNGSTAGGILVANADDQTIKDLAASLLTEGSHSGISYTYDGTVINSVLQPDLSNYAGIIRADAFVGSVFADDSSLVNPLVDAVDGTINLDGTIKGNVIPGTTNTYDLGSSASTFRRIYVGSTGLNVGNATITNPSGSIIDLPVGSTVGGTLIGGGGGGGGVVEGATYKINIAASDSSVIIDHTTKTVTASSFVGALDGNVSTSVITKTGTDGTGTIGQFTNKWGTIYSTTFNGNLVGGVTGNVSGDVTGNLTGDVTGSLSGNVTGDLTGNVDGNLLGSVYGTDFTLLIDGANSKIVGPVFSDVTGDVYGNLYGDSLGFHTGDVKGSLFADDSTRIIDATQGSIRITNGLLTLIDSNIYGTEPASTWDNTLTSTDPIIVIGDRATPSTLFVEGNVAPVFIRGTASPSNSTTLEIQSNRLSGNVLASIENNDYLPQIVLSAYNGSIFKKAVVFSSQATSAVTGGSFDTNLTINVLNSDTNYRQFIFQSDGFLDLVGLQLYSASDVELGAIPSATGQFGYGVDRKSLVFYDGTAYRSVSSFVSTIPTTSTDPGKQGQITADANFLYICYSDNNWIRVAKDGTW